MENTVQYQIVSCSGASNTGKFADEVARQLAATGEAGMICLAKVAIGAQDLIEQIKSKNSTIVVLDGCPTNCAQKILENVGITNKMIHINTTDFDIVKGKTPYTPEKAREIIEGIRKLEK